MTRLARDSDDVLATSILTKSIVLAVLAELRPHKHNKIRHYPAVRGSPAVLHIQSKGGKALAAAA